MNLFTHRNAFFWTIFVCALQLSQTTEYYYCFIVCCCCCTKHIRILHVEHKILHNCARSGLFGFSHFIFAIYQRQQQKSGDDFRLVLFSTDLYIYFPTQKICTFFPPNRLISLWISLYLVTKYLAISAMSMNCWMRVGGASIIVDIALVQLIYFIRHAITPWQFCIFRYFDFYLGFSVQLIFISRWAISQQL